MQRGMFAQKQIHYALVGFLFYVLCCPSWANAQFPTLGLRSISQGLFSPGESYEVRVLESTNGDEISELVFSHDGIRAQAMAGPSKPYLKLESIRHGSFRVTVDENVPEGRYEVRAVGRYGLSNPRSILVRRGTKVLSEHASDFGNAAKLDVGTSYFHTTVNRQRNCYSIPANSEGSRWIELETRAIDSQLTALVEVMNSKGIVLESCVSGDQSRLRFPVPSTTEDQLYVSVSDMLYRGGASYGYVLRVDEEPKILRDQSSRDIRSVSVNTSKSPVLKESDARAVLRSPARIEGTFDSVDDVDSYLFHFDKAKKTSIEVFSQRLGEPTDVRLSIERAISGENGVTTWQRVATSEDSQSISDSVAWLSTRDPSLQFTSPEKGDYRIVLKDLDRGETLGSIQRYVLAVDEPSSDFALLAYHVYPHKDPNSSRPVGVHLLRGGSTTIRVFAIRKGDATPIKVELTGLPLGLTCKPSWIAANQSMTDLTIVAAADAQDAKARIGVQGTTLDGGISRQAEFASLVWERDGYRDAPVVSRVDSLWVSATSLDASPLTVTPEGGEVIVVEKGKKTKLAINLKRSDQSKNNVVVRARNLPPGVKVGDLTINADKDSGEWTIDVSGGAKSGSYSFWGQAETKVKFAFNPQALERNQMYLDRLKSLRKDPEKAAEHAMIDQEISESEKTIASLKKQSSPRDVTVYIPTHPITLKIK